MKVEKNTTYKNPNIEEIGRYSFKEGITYLIRALISNGNGEKVTKDDADVAQLIKAQDNSFIRRQESRFNDNGTNKNKRKLKSTTPTSKDLSKEASNGQNRNVERNEEASNGEKIGIEKE